MSDRRSRGWLWLVIAGAAYLAFVLVVTSIVYSVASTRQRTSDYGLKGGGGDIGVVDIEGVILDPKPVIKDLNTFADDDSIKAILLHVNTPGGGAAASEEINRAV